MGRERRQKSIVATESFGQARGTSAYDQVSEPLQSARTPASRRRGRGEPHLVEYFMATLAAKGVDFAASGFSRREGYPSDALAAVFSPQSHAQLVRSTGTPHYRPTNLVHG